ncbi:Maturation and nuclear export of 40S ribosomal subunits interacting protein [Lecanora helva]
MPLIVGTETGKTKRKGEGGTSGTKRRRTEKGSPHEEDPQSEILRLEESILESKKNYNGILKALDYVEDVGAKDQKDVVASVALCRIFCRLMAAGSLTKDRDSDESEVIVVQWLHERFRSYKSGLLDLVRRGDYARQSTALTLLMRLLKEEKAHLSQSNESLWRAGAFSQLVPTLVEDTVAHETRMEFAEKYMKFDDVRYYTFDCIAKTSRTTESVLQNRLSILLTVDSIPESQDDLSNFFVGSPSKAKHELFSLAMHKKQAQKAWMAILSDHLSKIQRKAVLDSMTHHIAPWFLEVELLMDFLTDSLNVGGATSLMALSGLFYLIQHKNLDYPQFYSKLYTMLDQNILHSKHRSRFFRLLETFLASTHLPAALVASFIKRLSRLTLHAPPSGIVVVVPWIYNLLKNHPSCTFMIHRNIAIGKEEEGWGDPFQMEERDPMATDALESSLWEVHMLQNHYHPNVATLAKIISEQFTKQAYNMEDFLDHSYGTMLDAELLKDVKKPPEIEYEIPKRIFLKHDAESEKVDSMLVKLWNFD